MNTANMGVNPPRGEIDLIDLILLLRRNGRVFLIASVIGVLVGLGLSIAFSGRYEYSVTISLGGIRESGKGFFNLIESPKTTMAEIKSAIIPAALTRFTQQYPEFAEDLPKIEVTIPDGSDIVVLSARGRTNRETAIETLLENVTDMLAQRQTELLRQRVESLKALINQEILTTQQQLTQLTRSRDTVTQKGDSASRALTFLLIDSQVTSLQNRLYSLHIELQVGLVTDVRYTHALEPPQRSPRPIGMSLVEMLVLSLLGGLVFGFIITLIAQVLKFTSARVRSLPQ